MGRLWTWLIPPLVGAVIGYVTNWLAIKMLFRPLSEKRFLGRRLPFTPGLLPRERERLARSVGETVAAELLTSEVLRRRLLEPDIRSALARAIDARLETLLDSRAAGLLPRPGAQPGPLSRLVSGAWASLASSEAFRSALEEALRKALLDAGSMPLSRFLGPELARELASIVVGRGGVEALRARLRAALEAAYAEPGEGAASARGSPSPSIGSLLPAEAAEPLVRALAEGLYRAALPVLEHFLNSPEVKVEIGFYAKDVIRSAIGRLSLLQRFIVGAAQYERNLSEGMPETVDSLVEAAMALLREPAMAERAAQAACRAYEKAQESSFGRALAGLVARSTAEAALDAALDALAERGPEVAERAAALAGSKAGASLHGFLGSFGLPAEELSARAAAAVSRALTTAGGGSASRILGSSLAAFVEALGLGFGDASLAQAIGAGPGLRAELSSLLADRALAILAEEAGRIVEGLDVKRIVEDRIGELEMAEVERMILAVADKELRWITVLGGVLGGLIGLAQSLLSYLSSRAP